MSKSIAVFDDSVVPDRDALLVVGNASELALDDVLDKLRLPLERALVDAVAGPEEKADDERQRSQAARGPPVQEPRRKTAIGWPRAKSWRITIPNAPNKPEV